MIQSVKLADKDFKIDILDKSRKYEKKKRKKWKLSEEIWTL